MKQARAFAPGNVSCVFKVVPHEDPARMHSLGMGFTVPEGVIVEVSAADRTTVSFNGAEFAFATVLSVIEALAPRPVRVVLESPLPLSGGFGLSGASALSTALALNELFELGRTRDQLGLTAHVAEVTNLTGLGDIAGQFRGGCNIKTTSHDPLAATPLPVPEQPVWYRFFSAINTKEVIGHPEQKRRINEAADAVLGTLSDLAARGERDFAAYVRASKQFAVQSGLLRDPDVLATIEAIEVAGGHASMIMLGNAVFSTIPFEGATKTRISKRAAEVLP
ncbi:MAG: GHMP kinase [Gammaproteobacteria bacterium]|nr:GHMP kinase [Gammaproteobacteria bacterium]